MLNETPLAQVYRSCMEAVNDAEYCAKVIDVVIDSAKRVYSYVPEGRTKPKIYVLLAPDVDYVAGVLVDKDKKSVIILLRAPRHAVSLLYERNKDGWFTLKSATVSNNELAALMNGPFKLSDNSEGDGL
ncbi:hypothetical protein PyrSV_gp37 [Pyrobaculum spherical virus]|uniref:Uncharacterized protein n=1 Tax=Pyrobaculum spherical virus (isolate United States/Yellowstone) TaxID=654907 RepID=Q6ZYG6_PSVY|nr:hypothetical protein PyrSV_gp37 [Pyrobaculum spherical virus]CAG25656.1 hypothetical protein [Pyrobaculum spherical virus]